MLSETIKGASDNNKWKQDLWEPIEGEMKQQVQQWLAHNRKLKNEHKKMKNRGKNVDMDDTTCRTQDRYLTV